MNGLGLSNLDIGMSESGFFEYVDQLKLDLINNLEDILLDISGVRNALEAGWTGQSCGNFMHFLSTRVYTIRFDIESEYNDLMARLDEIRRNYSNQDLGMFMDQE